MRRLTVHHPSDLLSVSRTGHPKPRTANYILVLRPRASDQSPDLQTQLFCHGGVVMRPDDGGVDDQIFKKSESSDIASNIRHQTPLVLHLLKHLEYVTILPALVGSLMPVA